MLLAQSVGAFEVISVVLYLLVIGYLGWLGYRRTKTSADYLVAGRKTHPFIMALSYGATFISTSAIVGFGGVAAMFGMSVLWLTVCNIFVGIFVAFIFLGGPTRHMGHRLDAHTFPELLGRRYQSRFVQVFAGLVIFCFIPLYAAAVLIGGTEFIATAFKMDYNAALLLFAAVVAAYVITGGLKSVMYTDTLQGAIMFVGMVLLLIFTYAKVGGVSEGHRTLTELAPLVPSSLRAMGHNGWTAMPSFGFGDKKYDLWWIVISTIVMGVGIGVLAQPQLVVRFMVVKSRRELNRAVLVGGVFILMMTGVAFTVGNLSNAFFVKHGPIFTGRVEKTIHAQRGQVLLALTRQDEKGCWVDVKDEKGEPKKIPAVLVNPNPYVADAKGTDGKPLPIARGRSISIVYAKGNMDNIIPTYITSAMPKWFGVLFLLTLLSAAMSTLSSQFHTTGAAAGRDIYEQLTGGSDRADTRRSMHVVRIGMIFGIILAVVIGYYARSEYIIARATAIFFGMCASTFLPAFLGGLFFRWTTKAGAIASMITGFLITTFWLTFVKAAEAKAIGLVQLVTGGKDSILANRPNWPVVDPLIVALPISLVVMILVSLMTRPPSEDHLNRCFRSPNGSGN